MNIRVPLRRTKRGSSIGKCRPVKVRSAASGGGSRPAGGGRGAERIRTHVVPVSWLFEWLEDMEEKGYLVESRRGSGGFIRIVRILPVEEQQEEPTVDEILHYWHENRMLTDREFELLHYLMGIMDIPEREKRQVLRQAVQRMVDAS